MTGGLLALVAYGKQDMFPTSGNGNDNGNDNDNDDNGYLQNNNQ